MDESRTETKDGIVLKVDGRRAYIAGGNPEDVWVAVSNGQVHTHNEDPAYEGCRIETVEVTYIHNRDTDDAWREATCMYDHIISLDDYLKIHPTAQADPVGYEYPDTDLQVGWGITATHTPEWVKRWGTN